MKKALEIVLTLVFTAGSLGAIYLVWRMRRR